MGFKIPSKHQKGFEPAQLCGFSGVTRAACSAHCLVDLLSRLLAEMKTYITEKGNAAGLSADLLQLYPNCLIMMFLRTSGSTFKDLFICETFKNRSRTS